MFPLNIVICPGETVNLHIFEHRYRQLIHECEAQQITFGIPFVNDGTMENMCSEIQLQKIAKKYENGTMDVTVKAIGLLKISKFYNQLHHKLYPGAEIEKIGFNSTPNYDANKVILPLLEELYRLLGIKNVPLKTYEYYSTSDNLHKMGLTIDQEIELLSMTSEMERAIYIQNHLATFITQVRLMEQVKSTASQNGHFKNLVPPF